MKSFNRKVALLSVFIFFPLTVIQFFLNFQTPFQIARKSIPTRNITCVRAERFQSNEGIGAFIMRNQIAFFLADRFDAKISVPTDVGSVHHYHAEAFFSECPPAVDGCRMVQDDIYITTCPLGDCDCRFRKLQPYLSQLQPDCRVISFENNRRSSNDFSGCYTRPIHRYFGGPNLWPKPYDAIHYRQGDLANITGKPFTKRDLGHIMDAMCRLSDRDIIVVTEGQPEVPVCSNRVVLAGNTTMQQALHIMQHAQHIALGRSYFAALMAHLATPRRLFVGILDYDSLRWVKAPNYTIVGRSGQLFHFDDHDILQRAYNSYLEKRTFIEKRTYSMKPQPGLEADNSASFLIPKRRWETEALLPDIHIDVQ